MSKRLDLDAAAALLGGDRSFLLEAIRHEVVCESALSIVTVERVRVVRTLVRDLDVNWESVEVIMNLRDELMATRRQVAELIALIRERESLESD